MKILIVKTSALGDIIHAFPILDYLKMVQPDCQIDWVAEKGGATIVQAQPAVHHTYISDTKLWRKGKNWKELRAFIRNLRQTNYDVLFDLQGNTKSGLITGFAKAKVKVGFGWNSVAERPNLLFTKRRFNPPAGHNIREDYLFLAQSYFDDFRLPSSSTLTAKTAESNALEVMVCPGSNWANKQLTPETLQGFLDKIHAQVQGVHFHIIWGTPTEKELAEKLRERYTGSRVVDKLSLPELQAMMGRMNLVIAMDSLPLHLAGTTTALTYSVFGASSAAKYNPLGPDRHALQGPCPYGRTFEKRCPILRTCPTGACIKGITPEQIWDDFWPWFQGEMESGVGSQKLMETMEFREKDPMQREFTATVHIIEEGRVLLIHHRKFGKWMPPGGHIEPNETPAEAAIREAKEETGLDIVLQAQENVWIERSNARSMPRPYMCLLEEVPPQGSRPHHQHMDMIFVGTPVGGALKQNHEETEGVRWWSLDELEKLTPDVDIFTDTILVLRHILQINPSKKESVQV